MVRPRVKRTRRDGAAGPEPTSETAPQVTQLMDLHDGVLQHIVKRLGVDRRTVMLGECCGMLPICVSASPTVLCTRARSIYCVQGCMFTLAIKVLTAVLLGASCSHNSLPVALPPAVCKRLRDLARRVVHSRQLPGMSVQDAIEAAEPGDTVHLLPGFYKVPKPACWQQGQAAWCRHAAPSLQAAAGLTGGIFFDPGTAADSWALQLLQRNTPATCGPGLPLHTGGAPAEEAAAPDLRRRAGAHPLPCTLRHHGHRAGLPAGEPCAEVPPGGAHGFAGLEQGWMPCRLHCLQQQLNPTQQSQLLRRPWAHLSCRMFAACAVFWVSTPAQLSPRLPRAPHAHIHTSPSPPRLMSRSSSWLSLARAASTSACGTARCCRAATSVSRT